MNGLVHACCRSLLGAYCAEGHQQFVVYRAANPQKSPNNRLDTSDALSIEGGRCIFLVCMLDLAAVFDFPSSVGDQLAPFWDIVAKGNGKVRDVNFHGQVARSVCVIGSLVPLQVDA